MPRPRKPTKILQFTGAFAKNPQRAEKRKGEPKANGPIGSAPEWFDDDERAAWNAIVAEAPGGVLALRDREMVTCAALLGAQLRKGERDSKVISAYRVALGELGMTPAAASKVSAPDGEKENNSLAAI